MFQSIYICSRDAPLSQPSYHVKIDGNGSGGEGCETIELDFKLGFGDFWVVTYPKYGGEFGRGLFCLPVHAADFDVTGKSGVR